MAGTKPPLVSLVDCSRYQEDTINESLNHLLEPWGGPAGLVRPGWKVLLKPNLLTAAPPEEAVTTHPLLIGCLAALLIRQGARVYIGDSSGSGSPDRVNRVTGMQQVIEKTGAESLPFDKVNQVQFAGFYMRCLPLAAALNRMDLVINIGNLKTHALTGLTGAVKNTYGCVVGKHKQLLHLEYPLPKDFSELLLDIYLAVRPGLSILDAVVAMEGPGPRSGRPRRIGVLMASRSGVALDTVAAAITGFSIEQVTTLAAARRRGLPGTDLSNINIVGISWRDVAVADFDRGPAAAGSVGGLPVRILLSRLRNRIVLSRRYPVVISHLCSGCGECVEHCPPQVIEIRNHKASIKRKGCIRCYCCQEFCPRGAIKILPG
jgi:uncharacterized protein (DUF362 family)/NAD-dependent dihydropyrimidine dehydrogenase PreA subunit